MNAYDKRGIPIHVGDVLKVFHFIGPRKKRYYMYKHVVSEENAKSGNRFLLISHLHEPGTTGTYNMLARDHVDEAIEIVQGYAGVSAGRSYEDRKRKEGYEKKSKVLHR